MKSLQNLVKKLLKWFADDFSSMGWMDMLIGGKQSKYKFNNCFLRFYNDFITTDHFNNFLLRAPNIRFGMYHFH